VSVWSSLRGQERVAAQLQRAIARDRVPHAYLFSGPAGAPLLDAALALASALVCARAPGEGCAPGDAPEPCSPCRKVAAGIHPDVVTLAREGAAQIIPIEVVRAQVIARLGMPPHEASLRVLIIEEATALPPPAANALLKTLEEPPGRALFVLGTTAPEQLLPTLRSRCQRVRFAAGPAAADPDPARAARIAALGAELAGDQHDAALGARVAETKGDAAPVLIAAAQRLAARARAAALAGELGRAARAAARAQAILSWHTAVAIHNASPALAIDALAAQLARLGPVGADGDLGDGGAAGAGAP
jgi:DNA polymerase-3 subunit delta'